MTPELALSAGTGFLAGTARDGRWSAFHLYPGISDEWVTAYVAASLAEAKAPGGAELAGAALRGLAGRQRPDGRFGFNARAIGDADSTLWALRLAACAVPPWGVCSPAVPAGWDVAVAEAVLDAHARPGGALSTYAAPEPIRAIIEAPPDQAMAGWCAPHPCVTAVGAGLARTAAPAVAYLTATQRPDGSWPAYWWADPEYTVGLAAEALAGYPGPGARLAAHRAAEWAVRRLGADGAVHTGAYPQGSAFATALALRAVLAGAPHRRDAIGAATGWLCRHVRLDGSWPASAVLRVPHPDDTAPHRPGGTVWVPGGRKEGAVVVDTGAAFTTATVVAALSRVRIPVKVGA